MKSFFHQPADQNGSALRETNRLYPILKWAGGKEKELKHILPQLPAHFVNYYEPFVGGGAVYTAIRAERYFINDKSDELICLYRTLAGNEGNGFFERIEEIIEGWKRMTEITSRYSDFFKELYHAFAAGEINDDQLKDKIGAFVKDHGDEFDAICPALFHIDSPHFIKEIRVNLFRKIRRMKELEATKGKLPADDILDNIETALKSGFYMHFRQIYNQSGRYGLDDASRSAVFLFIRNYAYSGMFRYNASGGFNVPYGGMDYNRKNFGKKVEYLKSPGLRELLKKTTITNADFEAFFHLHVPSENDFVFLDPPYDSEFSTYAGNAFTRADQARLADYLINSCKAKWMMVIKNTDFIYGLYADKGLSIRTFDKTYLVSFMNRNDKKAEHLLITNY